MFVVVFLVILVVFLGISVGFPVFLFLVLLDLIAFFEFLQSC